MPSSVAWRVRIRAIRTAVIAACLGPQAVRLRSSRLSQVPTGLGEHDGRAAYQRDCNHNDAQNLAHRGAPQAVVPPPEAKLAGPAPEATQRTYSCSVGRLVPSEPGWVRSGAVFRNTVQSGAAAGRGTRATRPPPADRHDTTRPRADHKLLIVPHRTLDAGGNRSRRSTVTPRDFAPLHTAAATSPQRGHQRAGNARRRRVEPRRCAPRLTV